jgi:hypothetical protein
MWMFESGEVASERRKQKGKPSVVVDVVSPLPGQHSPGSITRSIAQATC